MVNWVFLKVIDDCDKGFLKGIGQVRSILRHVDDRGEEAVVDVEFAGLDFVNESDYLLVDVQFLNSMGLLVYSFSLGRGEMGFFQALGCKFKDQVGVCSADVFLFGQYVKHVLDLAQVKSLRMER